MPLIRNPNPEQGASPFIEVDANGNVLGRPYDPLFAFWLMWPVFLVTSPVLVAWLYPITAALVAIVAWVGGEMADARLNVRAGPGAIAAMVVPALVVVWIAMRVEMWLGEYRFYRWPRHVLRLLVPAAVVSVLARIQLRLSEDVTVEQHLRETVTNGSMLTAMLVAIVVTQLVLTLGRQYVRSDWHAFLRTLWLRPTRDDDEPILRG